MHGEHPIAASVSPRRRSVKDSLMFPPTSATSSPSVAAAFSRRDPNAVRAFYREYGRLVYAVAVRVLGRNDLAEDATQQTFVRAWQAADRFDIERDPAPWLATIAKRVAMDLRRAEVRRTARDRRDTAGMLAAAPDHDTLDLAWRVREAIDTLPTDEAAVVRLQHLDGLTHSEIADTLGIAPGTVKSRSHRAHQKLALQLGDLREPVS
jgi:RNA polymerase sigma-70 factor, ECF subfamily